MCLFPVTANYVLPRGASVTISPIVTHHCPHLYPNPGVFNPENFSVENVAKRHKYSYIAFSGGPRGCIGGCTLGRGGLEYRLYTFVVVKT